MPVEKCAEYHVSGLISTVRNAIVPEFDINKLTGSVNRCFPLVLFDVELNSHCFNLHCIGIADNNNINIKIDVLADSIQALVSCDVTTNPK